MIAHTNLNAATHISKSQTFSSALPINKTYIDEDRRHLPGTVKLRQIICSLTMRTKGDGLQPGRNKSYLGEPARRHRACLVPYRNACPSNSAVVQVSWTSTWFRYWPVKPIYFLRSNTPLRLSSNVVHAAHYTDLI